MTNFGIAFSNENSYEYLLKSTNDFFGNKNSINASILAPTDDNYVIRINKNGIRFSIVNNDNFQTTIDKICLFLNKNFTNQIIGIWYENPNDSGLINNIDKVKIVNLQ